MHPILAKIGPLTIYSWGTMVALAFLIGTVLALWLAKREGIKPERALDIIIYVIIAAILGARVWYVIQFWHEFKDNPLQIIMVHQGGLIFYGGLFGVIAVMLWYAVRHRLSIWKILDIASLPTALGYVLARIGCFLNGCCYGIETKVPWAVQFPHLPGLRHPTQIYSAISVFLIFIILAALWKRKLFDGQVFLTGIILYSIYRLVVEFFRYNPTHYFGLSVPQIICILLFVLAIPTLIRMYREA